MAKFPTAPERRQRDPNKAIVRVEGDIASELDGPELNNDGTQSFITLRLEDAMVTRANGEQEDQAIWVQRFPFSSRYSRDEDGNRIPALMDSDGEFLFPENSSPWYDVIVPSLLKVGIDPKDPASQIDAVGRSLVLERQTVGRVWADDGVRSDRQQLEDEVLRGEDGQIVRAATGGYTYLDDDGEQLFWDREAKSYAFVETGEITEKKPRQVQKQYVGLLPSELT